MKKFLGLLLLIPVLVSAQKDPAVLLKEYMKAQADVNHFSGAVLIMKKGTVLLREGYGKADETHHIANTADTRFRVGSITKEFTAACILQLAEQKKLDLQDKLSKYFPGYPKGDSVTIHMLLNHTSGIYNYTNSPDFGTVMGKEFSIDDMISYFKDKPYTSSPGLKYSYTNSGFLLLGALVEKVSGMSYSEYLKKNVLNKAGMNGSGTELNDLSMTSHAQPYTKSGATNTPAPPIALQWAFGAGMLYSTLDDMYKWDRALYTTSVLNADSKQKMFTPGLGRYGYGFIIDSFDTHPRIWHNGAINGFSSHFTRFIADDICIVVFSNNETNADLIDAGLSNIIYGNEVLVPYVHKEISIDSTILYRYTGKFNGGLVLEFIVRDGKLWRHRDGTKDIQLIPESQTKFFYGDGSDRQIEFEVDASGKLIKTYFINNGLKGEIKKIE